MNNYTLVILVALFAEFTIQTAAGCLSLSSILRKPAECFADLIGSSRYGELQRYVLERTWLYIGSEALFLGSFLPFWFLGGFQWLDDGVRSWGLGWLWTGVLVVAALFLARAFVALPFAIISTFWTEARFGFNNTSPGTFLTDLLKVILVCIAVGGPLLIGVLTLFSKAGRYWWVYGWIAVAASFVLFQMAESYIILPVFNSFTPLADRQIREAIAAYAAKVDFPLGAVSVMNVSIRSNKSNAFLTGFGSGHRLVVADSLLCRHTIPEVLAVVAHEVGHYKLRHIPVRISIQILQLGLFFLLTAFFLTDKALSQAFYVNTPSAYLGLVFCSLLYAPVAFVSSIFVNWLARQQEYDADRFAVETTMRPNAMMEVLCKMAVDNLSQLAPHRLDVVLNYSHPPLTSRIRTLQALKTEPGE